MQVAVFYLKPLQIVPKIRFLVPKTQHLWNIIVINNKLWYDDKCKILGNYVLLIGKG